MVEKLMKNLGISREEALQVIADDKAIDKGEKLFELSAEQKKAAKQATRADNKPRSAPTKLVFIYNEKKYKITLSCPRS